MTSQRRCKSCRKLFPRYGGQRYCSEACQLTKAPAVYQFICPDGRRYVGSRCDCRKREAEGVHPSNSRLRRALGKYPPETWAFKYIEHLQPGCSISELRQAEQRSIDRLGTWRPSRGFNILPGVWDIESAAREHARQHIASIFARTRMRERAERIAKRDAERAARKKVKA